MFGEKKIKLCLRLLSAGILILFALMSFNTPTQPKKLPLIVERQECAFQFMVGFIYSHDIDIGMTIDVPVGGNQVLIDSVTRLLNDAVYAFLESGKGSGFTPEQVYCSDNMNFVKHYYDAYKPLIADTSYEFEWDGSPGPFTEAVYLTIMLIDQTDKFVTYEIVNLYIGEGAEFYNEWVTFSKADGHRLRTVVDDEQVPPLLKCTSGTENDVWEDVEYRFSIGGEVSWRCNFGLTTDSLWCQYFYAPGIEETFPFDMKTARSCLSEEAKKLLE